MAVGFKRYHQDSVFYQLTSLQDPLSAIPAKSIQNISITEEIGKMITGSIKFIDERQIYSKVLTRGTLVRIDWGYRDPVRSVFELLPNLANPTEYKGPVIRSGLVAMIMNPGGGGDQNGMSTYEVKFRAGFTMVRDKVDETHYGTLGTIITKILARNFHLPIVTTLDFADTGPITKGLVQTNETDFAFLRRIARKNKKVFMIGSQLGTGIPVGAFLDPGQETITGYKFATTGGVGLDHLFEWRDGLKNVLKYEWDWNFANDGTGDHLQFALVGGIPIEIGAPVERETVLGYKLDFKKLQEAFVAERKKGGIQAATKLFTTIVNTTDFQSQLVQRFWTQSDFKTAPQSAGLEIKLDVVNGNPLYNPMSVCKFGKGFPDLLRETDGFKIHKVVHNIGQNGGYTQSLEIRDRLFAP